MKIDLMSMLGGISTALGIFGVLYGFKKNGDKNIKDTTKEQIEMSTKLDYVIAGIDDIKLNMKTQDTKINSLTERITTLEERVKNNEYRTDKLEV